MTGAIVVAGWVILFILAGSSFPLLLGRRAHSSVAATTRSTKQTRSSLVDRIKITWFDYWTPAIVGVVAGVIAAATHDGSYLAAVFSPFLLSNAYVWFSSAHLIPRSANRYAQVATFSVINGVFFAAFSVFLG